MEALLPLSGILNPAMSILFGLVIAGLGLLIFVRRDPRIGGLLFLAGIAQVILMFSSTVYNIGISVVPYGLDNHLTYVAVGNIVFAVLRLLFWLPLVGSLFFVLKSLPPRTYREGALE